MTFRHHRLGLSSGLLAVVLSGCSLLDKQGSDQDRLLQARQLANQATALTQQDRWDQAGTLFSQAIELAPSHDRTHAEYARVLWQTGDREAAIERMQQAVDLSAKNAQYRIELGHFLLALDRPDEALKQAEAAVKIDLPVADSATAYALRGDIRSRQGSQDQALADYLQVLSVKPEYPQIELAAARIYLARQRPQRALALLTVLYDRTPPAQRSRDLIRMQARACKQLGRYNDAIQLLVTAVENGPPDAELYFQLAESQWLAGQPENAQLVLRQVLALEPDHAASRVLLETIAGQ